MASWRLARVAAVPSLEVPGTQDGKEFSRRWIMIHMMEEYARHCGHADPAPGADPRSGRGVSTAGDGAAAYPGVGKMPPSMPSARKPTKAKAKVTHGQSCRWEWLTLT